MTNFVFTLQLIELIHREETLRNVISSVTRNLRSIIFTFILAVILVYFFSIVGFMFLQGIKRSVSCQNCFLRQFEHFKASRARMQPNAFLRLLRHLTTIYCRWFPDWHNSCVLSQPQRFLHGDRVSLWRARNGERKIMRHSLDVYHHHDEPGT